MNGTAATRPYALGALTVALVALLASGVEPHDRFTWWLEVAPVLFAVPLLAATFRRFPLSPLAYGLIAVHAVILCVGAHWTYARVPLGDWAAEAFGFARNHYDRVGHFAQGFVPAILAREVLLRTSPLVRGGWLAFLVVAVSLAISAAYELVEWAVALGTGEAAESFLGTQGDVWDTQIDMFLALVGAIAALVTLSRRHDRSMARVVVARGG